MFCPASDIYSLGRTCLYFLTGSANPSPSQLSSTNSTLASLLQNMTLPNLSGNKRRHLNAEEALEQFNTVSKTKRKIKWEDSQANEDVVKAPLNSVHENKTSSCRVGIAIFIGVTLTVLVIGVVIFVILFWKKLGLEHIFSL
jgi:serine/threonine protein kinase